MRLIELTLENYGVYKRRTLCIGEGPGLTIVHGANEAGKSTCLAAVGDLLFGIPTNTCRGTIFGYDSMRIGATLKLSDGRALALRRRKGRGKTLVDGGGAPLEETVLAGVLGATSRERFETLFGLNHENLRLGGERLLAADGEIGRLIVEAGGGLRSLVDGLERLDIEANSLFAPRKNAERAFYCALEDFEVAAQRIKADVLSLSAFEDARRIEQQVESNLSARRDEKQQVAVEVVTLERLLRVVPYLRELERLEIQIAAHADVASLPADFAETIWQAQHLQQEAQTAYDEAAAAHDKLASRLAGLVSSQPLIAAEMAIRDLREQAVYVARGRSERPKLVAEIEALAAQLAHLRQQLGLHADDDALGARLPSAAAVEHLQQLVSATLQRRPALHAMQRRGVEIASQISTLKQRLHAATRLGLHRSFGTSVAEFSGLPTRHAAAGAKAGRARGLQQAAEVQAAALGFASCAALQ